jgi:hypothetical protein
VLISAFQFIIYLTFFVKFDRLLLFNFLVKKIKTIFEVHYMLNDITVKNNDFFNKIS